MCNLRQTHIHAVDYHHFSQWVLLILWEKDLDKSKGQIEWTVVLRVWLVFQITARFGAGRIVV
jgi:hypothetical protein